MKRGRRQKRQTGVNPVEPPAADAPAVTRPVRTEHEIPLLPVEAAPRDRDGHPIVPTCWVRVEYPSTLVEGHTVAFTGEVLRVCRVENGRDHGAILVYVLTEDSGRWGRCARIEHVRVRKKPAHVKADEHRDAFAA